MFILPAEVLLRIVRFVTRDDIESAMLVNRQFCAMLDANTKDMPRRAIEEARIETEYEDDEGPFLVTVRTPANTLTYRHPLLQEAFFDLAQCVRCSYVAEFHVRLRNVQLVSEKVWSSFLAAISSSHFRSAFIEYMHLDESRLIGIASRVDSDIYHGISLHCGAVTFTLLNAFLDFGICNLRIHQQYDSDDGVSMQLVDEAVLQAVFNPARTYVRPFHLSVLYADFSNTFCKKFIDACRARELPSGSSLVFRAIDFRYQERLDAYREFIVRNDEFGMFYEIANISATFEYLEDVFYALIR